MDHTFTNRQIKFTVINKQFNMTCHDIGIVIDSIAEHRRFHRLLFIEKLKACFIRVNNRKSVLIEQFK